MKRVIVLFSALCLNIMSGQQKPDNYHDIKYMKVLSIEDCDAAYIINCLDEKQDTIKILSEKKGKKLKKQFTQLKPGASYNFLLQKEGFADHLIIKAGGVIFWDSKKDQYKDRPHFADNVRNTWIK